jgi:hypothetical protein
MLVVKTQGIGQSSLREDGTRATPQEVIFAWHRKTWREFFLVLDLCMFPS